MWHDYPDIRALTDKEPLWWDANGTPRFVEFRPDLCPHIYATQVALVRISCQECGRTFGVEMHVGMLNIGDQRGEPKQWHYGDPPRHGDCWAGETMNCWDLEVLQVWEKGKYAEWHRRADLEGAILEE